MQSNDYTDEMAMAEAIQASLDLSKNKQTNNNSIDDDMELAMAIETSMNPKEKKEASASNKNYSEDPSVSNQDPLMFLNNLWAMADENIEPMLHSKCQINVSAKIADKDVTLIIDTGAQVNVMSINMVKKLGIESFMDERTKGIMQGVGSGKICGQIPYIEIKFGDISCPANFFVLDGMKGDKLEILIGFPFMMFYKTNLDFAKSQMTIGGHKVDMIIKEF